MPFQELHRKVARIALRAAAQHGFALAGGNALMADGVVDRFTEDVDLFTDDEAGVQAAAAKIEKALYSEGYTTCREDKTAGLSEIFEGMGEGLAEWTVTSPDGSQTMMLQLAYFDRTQEPVSLDGDMGPVLAIEDVIGGKAAAAASRAYPRDFLDLAAILRLYPVHQVLEYARLIDPGLDDADFAEAGCTLDELDDLAFARYGLGTAEVAQLRAQFADWPRTAPPRAG